MNSSLIYKNPEDFARFMVPHLEDALNAELKAAGADAMTFDVFYHDGREEEKGELHLHNVYDTYCKTGDLNAAIDFMNGIVEATKYARSQNPEMIRFDPNLIYPVLRPKQDIQRYNEEGYKLLRYTEIPGMDTVLLERNVGFSLLLNEEMVKANPQWDKLSLKQQAYENLRSRGWIEPNLQLQNPYAENCQVWVYLEPPVPVQCQLFMPELTAGRLPKQFIAAFPNKETTMLLICHAGI